MKLNGPDPEISLKFTFTLSAKQPLMMAGKIALGGVFTFTVVSAYPEHPSLSFTSKEYLELLNGFDYTTQAVRMISAGTAAPDSGMGKEGSVYFQIG